MFLNPDMKALRRIILCCLNEINIVQRESVFPTFIEQIKEPFLWL